MRQELSVFNPILDTYKKKIIENPIVDKILEMIAKANIKRLDFGLQKNNQRLFPRRVYK